MPGSKLPKLGKGCGGDTGADVAPTIFNFHRGRLSPPTQGERKLNFPFHFFSGYLLPILLLEKGRKSLHTLFLKRVGF
ncbi:MAG: hypothetical protein C6I01_06815 [Epsilonproteobacteria bacterium]|nr:hypothetical protein [Campylobacterota bacterium]